MITETTESPRSPRGPVGVNIPRPKPVVPRLLLGSRKHSVDDNTPRTTKSISEISSARVANLKQRLIAAALDDKEPQLRSKQLPIETSTSIAELRKSLN